MDKILWNSVFFVMPKLTDFTAMNKVNISQITFPSELKIADTTFNMLSKEDLS